MHMNVNQGIRWFFVQESPLGASEIFSIGLVSIYAYESQESVGFSYKKMWEAKIPMKVKIFMCLICKNVHLTKDNLIRKKLVG